MMRALPLVLAAVIVSGGCSFVMVRGAPTDEPVPAHWPICTEHRWYPLGDAGITALSALATYTFVTDHDSLASLGAIVSVPAMIAAGASAIYGLVRTSSCVRARDAYEQAAVQGR